jgi:hypothetical protein
VKNRFTISIIGAAVSFMIFATLSCNTKSFSTGTPVDYSSKQMLLSYLKQHKNVDTGASLFIDTLINKCDWNNCLQSVTHENGTLFYVPLNYNKNKNGVTFLYDKRLQKVHYGLITEFPNIKKSLFNKTSYSSIDVITGFYKNKLNKYTGSIRAFSLSNNFYWEMGYKNGKREFQKRITSRDPDDTASNYDYKNALVKYHLITNYDKLYKKNDWRLLGTTQQNDPFEITMGLTPDSLRIKLNFSGKSGYL